MFPLGLAFLAETHLLISSLDDGVWLLNSISLCMSEMFLFFHHSWIISWLQNSRLTDFFSLPFFLLLFIASFHLPLPSTLKVLFHCLLAFSAILKESENVSLSVFSYSYFSYFLHPHGREPARLLCYWNSPGETTGVGCHFLLHRIFLTRRLNLGLLLCRQILCHLNYQGNPAI